MAFNNFLIWDHIDLKFGGNIHCHNENQYEKSLCKIITYAKVIHGKPLWWPRQTCVFSINADCSRLFAKVHGWKFAYVESTILLKFRTYFDLLRCKSQRCRNLEVLIKNANIPDLGISLADYVDRGLWQFYGFLHTLPKWKYSHFIIIIIIIINLFRVDDKK